MQPLLEKYCVALRGLIAQQPMKNRSPPAQGATRFSLVAYCLLHWPAKGL